MTDSRPAHERLLGITVHHNGGVFDVFDERRFIGTVTATQLLAAADSLRALVETGRKDQP